MTDEVFLIEECHTEEVEWVSSPQVVLIEAAARGRAIIVGLPKYDIRLNRPKLPFAVRAFPQQRHAQ